MSNRQDVEASRAATAKLRTTDTPTSPLAPPPLAPGPRATGGEYSVVPRKHRAASEPGRASADLSAQVGPDGHLHLMINGQLSILSIVDARALAALLVNLLG
jgi:hypothetical protein